MRRFAGLLMKDAVLGIKDVFILLEIVFAVLFMLLLVFVIPEDIRTEGRVYLYDSTKVVEDFISAYESDPGQKLGEYYVDSREEVIAGMTKDASAVGLIITEMPNGMYEVDLLTQPYTKDALVAYIGVDMEDLLSMLKPPRGVYPPDVYESIRVDALQEGVRDALPFNQRLLPPVLFLMVGVLGLFAMVSLIGQERIDQTIRAYRLSPAGLWLFLLSKHSVILATGFITFSIIYLPMMGFAGYLQSLLIIMLTVVMGSSLGVILGAFYESPMGAIGWVFLLLLILALPAISLFNPMFSPDWLKLVPSHYSLFALDAAMFPDGNAHLIRQGAATLAVVSGILILVSAAVFVSRIRKEA